MTEQASRHTPTAVNLHQKSRLLSVSFDDGRSLELPSEYLRVFSRAAEVRTLDHPITGKEGVNITAIEPQGTYAVRLIFDDGHDTGIYSWDTLYRLGEQREQNWQVYLQRLREMGYERKEPASGLRRVKLLYFAYLVKNMRKESEELKLPASVPCVAGLLAMLRRRKPEAAPLFADGQVRMTVNRQFAEPFTRLEDGDEVGLVPTSPVAPATPNLV
jgi:DUF971 family protein/molybdopterin converting factor small subunit